MMRNLAAFIKQHDREETGDAGTLIQRARPLFLDHFDLHHYFQQFVVPPNSLVGLIINCICIMTIII